MLIKSWYGSVHVLSRYVRDFYSILLEIYALMAVMARLISSMAHVMYDQMQSQRMTLLDFSLLVRPPQRRYLGNSYNTRPSIRPFRPSRVSRRHTLSEVIAVIQRGSSDRSHCHTEQFRLSLSSLAHRTTVEGLKVTLCLFRDP